MIDVDPVGDPSAHHRERGEQHEQQILRPLGMQEIMELFRVSRDRAEALTCRDDFPTPIADLAAGAVWDRTDVDAWLAQHDDPVAVLLPKDTRGRQANESPNQNAGRSSC